MGSFIFKLYTMKKIIISCSALLMAMAVQAQKELKTTAINLFKNGTYFIVKEGSINAPKGSWSMSMQNFNPLLATFWITTGKENPIDRIEYMTDTIKTMRYIGSFQDILLANKGKKVQITHTVPNSTASVVKGTLENVYASNGLARIKNAQGGYTFINTSTITDLTFDENTNDRLKSDSLARVAKVFFNKEKSNMPVKVTYMQSGMSWAPSYNIKLVDDNKLQLAMNALIENFSEEIKDAELTLTLGAANFKYGTQLDPITQNYVSALGGSPYGFTSYDNNYNYQATQGLYSNMLVAGEYALDAPSAPAYADYANYTTAGEKGEDLYRYKLGKVSMSKNSKTSFSIFSTEVPYEDIYEINISDIVNYASTQRININEDQVYDVYHSLKIGNNTDVPFTTGPVFVQDKTLQPLAQDQIKYTPVGGKVKVQLAKATDILVKQNEEEVSSEDRSKKYNSYYYKKVTIKGTIKVENLQQKSVKICVTKTINGDVKDTSDGGTTKKSGKYTGLNPFSETEWNITLGKGEKKNITYSYDVYVYQG